MNSEFRTQINEALRGTIPLFDQHVLWSYGTGNVGVGDGELFAPHTAEENPFNPDEIVVAEQYGCDILLISRATGRLEVLYGERGVAGSGNHLNAPHSAHFMPSGPYEGHVLITEYRGEHRVLIIDRDTGQILWCCTNLRAPLEAIYWDDEHIMVSDCIHGIFKVRLSDAATVWHYDSEPHGHPFYLHKLTREYCDSYGGDLLIGYWGPNPVVRELDTTSKETVWIYGERQRQGRGELYDQLSCPVRALRYGIQERGGGLTVICDERSRILCVNRDKELVWELGGASGENLMTATPYIVLPTYVHVTKRGTLLVTDWGRNMIYEINPFCIPVRTEKDAYLFIDYATTDDFADSGIMESRGYRDKNVQVYNTHESAGLHWRVLGSHTEVRDFGYPLANHPQPFRVSGRRAGNSCPDCRAVEFHQGAGEIRSGRHAVQSERVYHHAAIAIIAVPPTLNPGVLGEYWRISYRITTQVQPPKTRKLLAFALLFSVGCNEWLGIKEYGRAHTLAFSRPL